MIHFIFFVTFIPLIFMALFITFFFDTISTQGTRRVMNEEWIRIWKEEVFG